MSSYFKNFSEKIGEVYVKPCSDNTAKDSFTSHGTMYKHPQRDSYMIDYYGSLHKAKEVGSRSFIFSHKKKEFYAELEKN